MGYHSHSCWRDSTTCERCEEAAALAPGLEAELQHAMMSQCFCGCEECYGECADRSAATARLMDAVGECDQESILRALDGAWSALDGHDDLVHDVREFALEKCGDLPGYAWRIGMVGRHRLSGEPFSVENVIPGMSAPHVEFVCLLNGRDYRVLNCHDMSTQRVYDAEVREQLARFATMGIAV